MALSSSWLVLGIVLVGVVLVLAAVLVLASGMLHVVVLALVYLLALSEEVALLSTFVARSGVPLSVPPVLVQASEPST